MFVLKIDKNIYIQINDLIILQYRYFGAKDVLCFQSYTEY